MGIPVSLILIAVGAILAFAVNQTSNSQVDVNTVGWIVLIVGLVGLILSMLLWERWGPGYWGWHRGAEPYPPRARAPRRRTVVEEEDAPGPGPGPPPPPP